MPSANYELRWLIFFIFRCKNAETSDYYFYYFGDPPTRNNSPDSPYNKKVPLTKKSKLLTHRMSLDYHYHKDDHHFK